MASLFREPNGRKRIQFTDGNGKRHSLRLGKATMQTAQAVKVKVENLNGAKCAGHAIDPETARWLRTIDQTLSDRLAAVGPIPKREAATLAAYLHSYVLARTDVKPLTKAKYATTVRMLIEHFGADTLLRSITAGATDQWRRTLVARGLGENTIRKHASVAKVFFNAAVRSELIEANPFADMKAAILPNPARYRFITPAETQLVIDSCPDAEWRLIVALGRWGGLRCPSETLALEWRHVDWEHGRIEVPSPKTEHHAGGASRTIPLFPQLKPYLEEAFELTVSWRRRELKD